MKKIIALLMALVMVLCAGCALAENTEKSNLGAVGIFTLRGIIPEGYTYAQLDGNDLYMISVMKGKENNKPFVTISIAYNEKYAETERLNDVDEDILEDIRRSFLEMDEEVTFENMETAFGTLVIKVTGNDFVDLYTMYKGYEFDFVIAGGEVTDADVKMVVDFISDLDLEVGE